MQKKVLNICVLVTTVTLYLQASVFYDFKNELIAKVILTVKSTFNAAKYTGPLYSATVTNTNELFKAEYASKQELDYNKKPIFKNPIIFHAIVLDNKKAPSVKLNKDYIKHVFILDLLKNANQYDYNGKITDNLENPIVSYYTRAIISEMQLTEAKITINRKEEILALEKHLKVQEGKFKWETIKFGSCDVEMVKLKSYSKSDMKRKPSGFWGIKPEAKANFYYFFVGEKNGKVIAGSISRYETQTTTPDEQKYINHMLKTFEIN